MMKGKDMGNSSANRKQICCNEVSIEQSTVTPS